MADADWDLGQKLIEQGACSLDQVREILSLQDRLRKMGAATPPFARVLIEKGYARRDQLLEAGAKERDLPPPGVEKPAPAAAAAAPGTKPLVWFAGILVAFCVLVLLGRGFFTDGPDGSPRAKPLTEEEKDAIFKTELEDIVTLANQTADFENAAAVVRGFEEYKAQHAGSKWEVEAHRRLTEYRALVEVHAKAELEELSAGEAPLREQRRWGELLVHYRKYPAKFLVTTESGARVQQKIQEVSQRMAETYARDKAEVVKFADGKKYSDALARVRELENSAPVERRDEVLSLRARIEHESRGAAEKSRQEVADAYFKVDGAFKEAMLRRDGFRAALVLREFLTAPWRDEQRPFVTVRGVDYPALLKAFEPWDPERIALICEAAIPEVDSPDRLGTGEGALLSLRNAAYMAVFLRDEVAQFHAAISTKEPLDLPGLGKGHFDKKDGKTVFIGDDGTVSDGDTNPLTERDLAALAMMVGPANAAMDARVGFFYFYSAPERLKEAYEHLTRAYMKNARGVKLFLGGLAVAAEGELRRELETKFGAAQDLYKNNNRKQAKKMLGDLLRFSEHPFTKSVRAEIEKMLYEIAEGTAREKKLAVQYLAKVEVVNEDTLRVIYDFNGDEQQDAFESVAEEGQRKFKGRWRIDHGAMESSADASVMRWKPRVKGDVTLEYDLTLVDEPQNIVVDLYYNKGESNHYAVVTGFDWVGKQDGDRDNSAEERFGMPRTCILKYPVTVDKSRWTNADAWDGWKSRLAGKPVGAWRPLKGQTVRMRVERQGAFLRLLADRVLVWEGQDEEYSEGQLLFYSDRRCRIDNLVITFKPQP